MLKIYLYLKKFIDLFKNTRGVRILKCKVDENGKKIIIFQTVGSFHFDEICYSEYKKGLIYDTEPSDVEKAAIFFHCIQFERYKIYSFDPINETILISSLQNNTVKINSKNWHEAVKFLKTMSEYDIKFIINSIISFELNNFNNNLNILTISNDFNDKDPNLNDYKNVIKIKRKNENTTIN